MKNTVMLNIDEKEAKASGGMAALILITLLLVASIVAMVAGIILMDAYSENYANDVIWREAKSGSNALGVFLFIVGIVYICIGWAPYLGLKIVKPNEALVLTLFGKYYGTLKREGFYFVNPFVVAVNPAADYNAAAAGAGEQPATAPAGTAIINFGQAQGLSSLRNRKISMKVSTLNNNMQKINDQLGNPIIIGIVVIWKVVNPTKAVFNVDNYKEFLSIQCDSALRNIVRLYPYDTHGNDNEKTLRGSSQEIAVNLQDEIQEKVEIGGIEVLEARITQLSYAPEIAAAMLQRQQASAIIDARQMIVEGAVGMVEQALNKLSVNNIVELDDDRKAAMVSNLLVVLCGNRDAQPVINSGTLY